MKKLKINIIAVLLIGMSTYMYAQNTSLETNEPSPFAIRMHVSPPMTFHLTDLKSDTYNDESRSGLGMNLGFDFMYYYYTKGNFRASVSLGLAYSNYRATSGLSYENSVWTTDIDNDDVLITETVNNLFERQSLKYLDIPLKFGFEYTINDKWNAYMSLGVTYGVNLKSNYTTEARITRTGFYPDFNLLVFDVDVDGAPYFYPTNKKMRTEDELSMNKNLSMEASLGLQYKLNEKISLLMGVKYMHGFSDVTEGNNEFIIKHDDAYHYSMGSLSTRNDKVKTRAIGVEFGVQMNIWKILK